MEPSGTALVTGASRGIGRAVAIELARRGFDVLAGMRNPDNGRDIEALTEDAAGSVRAVRVDVTRADEVIVPDDLRVLVNNAGIELDYLPVEHTPMDDWRTVFETNVFGLVDMTRRAIPALRRTRGVICNVTTSSLLVPVPFYAVYRASKAAVAAFGETLIAELAPFGVRVVEILPGPIATDMLAASERLPEAARYDDYRGTAEAMFEGRKAITDAITSPQNAASAIADAILDDDGAVRHGCDPLGQGLVDAWSADPLQFLRPAR